MRPKEPVKCGTSWRRTHTARLSCTLTEIIVASDESFTFYSRLVAFFCCFASYSKITLIQLMLLSSSSLPLSSPSQRCRCYVSPSLMSQDLFIAVFLSVLGSRRHSLVTKRIITTIYVVFNLPTLDARIPSLRRCSSAGPLRGMRLFLSVLSL